MSYSGDAAEQVVRMTLEGAEVAAKITGAGAKELVVLLSAILRDQQKAGDPLTFERIDTAVRNLYDGWESLPAEAKTMIHGILAAEDLDELYASYAREEQAAKEALLDFEGEYPDVLKEDNLGDILSHLMKRQEEQSEGQTFG